ncbi:aminotransferase class I/II-fold pyridoxal phosphate-dependent enzyme [Pedobacter metabolipauper]|uniref:GntR family transcriptional regulator/MocR family aminotransferase n=1 Tax=Pedobacter metabolipauper TaxID=425513 RepID=A0A4R6SSY6_9SPHI|nr:aminotransferase class I/II-fold pyridoxal phosphate-dependent enzyme [Pedobacter metabolipauper]TDQ07515.1 GntR family transcriptional regulator/MocR family aminotransferase [Pedobacter metabolipauper]
MRKINAQWKIDFPLVKNFSDKILEYFIDKIKTKEVRPGEKLPSQLAFAKLNGINVNTVKRVYFKLAALGWITTVSGSGTFVADRIPELDGPDENLLTELPIKLDHAKLLKPDVVMQPQSFLSIGFDTVNPYYQPVIHNYNYLVEIKNSFLEMNSRQQLETFKSAELKKAIRYYFNVHRRFEIHRDCLHLIFGRKECLDTVFKFLLKPGSAVVNTAPKDVILSESLQYCKTNSYDLSTYDINFFEKLENLLNQKKIDLLYLRPQCSYPEGNQLKPEECSRLIKLAKKHKFYIVEEDDYHEFWYKSTPFIPLANYNHDGHVIYLGALSRLSEYMSNTRVVIAAAEFIALLDQNLLRINPYRSILEEKAITKMIYNGDLWLCVRQARAAKKKDRDNIAIELEHYVGNYAKVNKPDCGLSFWFRFPAYCSVNEVVEYLKEHGMDMPIIPNADIPDVDIYYLRFGFGTVNLKSLEEALKLVSERLAMIKP